MKAPHREEIREMARVLLDVAREAADLVKAGHRSRPRALEKTAKDFVTEFDTRSQELVLARLERALPGVSVVAEEGSPEIVDIPLGLAITVDPLDGTTNFAHGHPFYCVAIGAIWNGEPIAGAVVAPSLALDWSGAREPSALGRAEQTPIFAQRCGEPCRVSPTTVLVESMIATGFPPDRERSPWNNFDSFMRVKRASRCVRRCGSAAIDIAFVADGTYDGYWERRLMLWDSAGAAAIAMAAGAHVTAIDGGPPRYERGHIVVSNGRIHDELASAIGAS